MEDTVLLFPMVAPRLSPTTFLTPTPDMLLMSSTRVPPSPMLPQLPLMPQLPHMPQLPLMPQLQSTLQSALTPPLPSMDALQFTDVPQSTEALLFLLPHLLQLLRPLLLKKLPLLLLPKSKC